MNAVKAGTRVARVAEDFGVPQQTVSNLVKRFQVRGTVKRAPKCGKPRKTTVRIDKVIRRTSIADPRKTAADINADLRANYGVQVHDCTVRRRLNDFNLFGRHAVKKPYISEKNRKARLQFAKEHLNWTVED